MQQIKIIIIILYLLAFYELRLHLFNHYRNQDQITLSSSRN